MENILVIIMIISVILALFNVGKGTDGFIKGLK